MYKHSLGATDSGTTGILMWRVPDVNGVAPCRRATDGTLEGVVDKELSAMNRRESRAGFREPRSDALVKIGNIVREAMVQLMVEYVNDHFSFQSK